MQYPDSAFAHRCALFLFLLAASLPPAHLQAQVDTDAGGLPQDHRRDAAAAAAAGDHEKAANLYFRLVQAGAEDRELLVSAVQSLEKIGRFNDALDVLARARKKFPDDLDFGVDLARIFNLQASLLLRTTGKMDTNVVFYFQDAIRAAESVLDKQPGNRDARLILASTHYALGEWDQAKVQADDLIERFPDHPGGHIVMGDLAFEQYKLLRGRSDEQEPGAARDETLQKVAGAGAAAETSYKRALSLDSERVAAHKNLGDVYAWTGRTAEALAAYREALLRDPGANVPFTWIDSNVGPAERAKFYEALGKDYLARPGADKRKAAVFAWYAAHALTSSKQFEAAERMFLHSLALDPTYLSAYYYAMYSAYFYREDEEDALKYGAAYSKAAPIEFADLIRAIPEESRKPIQQLILYLAKRAMDKGRGDESCSLFHTLAAILDTADAWNNYAFQARDSRRYAESEQAYRHALSLQPESGQLRNDLAVILHFHKESQKDWLEAQQLYEEAIVLAKKVLADRNAGKSDKATAQVTLRDATNNLAMLRPRLRDGGKAKGGGRR